MNRENNSPSRRSLIGTLGATALGVTLSGCSSPGISIDSNVNVADRNGDRMLQLEFSTMPADEVTRVHVMVNGSEETVIEEVDNPMDVELPITGGRRYEVEIVADPTGTGLNATRQQTDIGYIPRTDASLHGERTLCAHYYPWYGDPNNHDEWTDDVPSDPVLGEYNSRNSEIITRHLNWCKQAGIDWLSAAWWGPESYTDETLLEHVLEHEASREFTWSVLYETEGRFDDLPVDMDAEEPREQLASDLEYLEENYFGEPWYHTINDRPVVFVFVAFEFHGDAAGAWQEAVEPLDSDPYLIADIDNGAVPNVVPIVEAADAITTYNPYQGRDDIADVFREETKSMYRKWFLGREFADVDVMPTAIPGYNDTGIRDNPVLEPDLDRYDWCLRTARQYATGHDTVFITSFNEWYEDTQIEPYEAAEEHLINATDDVFSDDQYTLPQFDGTLLTIEFSDSVPEEELSEETDSNRELTFHCEEIAIESPEGEILSTYEIGNSDKSLFVSGAYEPRTLGDKEARWFGGTTTTAVYLKEFSITDTVKLTGQAVTEMDAVASVYGEEVGSGQVGPSLDTYRLS